MVTRPRPFYTTPEHLARRAAAPSSSTARLRPGLANPAGQRVYERVLNNSIGL
jgi:hypothetical protein